MGIWEALACCKIARAGVRSICPNAKQPLPLRNLNVHWDITMKKQEDGLETLA